jgi:Tfp pilus assembly protein PilZ
VQFPVVIHSVESHPGTVLNISEHGIFVAIDDSLPVDSLVEVEFRMPDGGETLRIIGEVCWARDYTATAGAKRHGIGIAFWSLGRAGREHLRRFVRAQAAEPLHG